MAICADRAGTLARRLRDCRPRGDAKGMPWVDYSL